MQTKKPTKHDPVVVLIATNDTDRTLTLAVDGLRYEYWFSENFPQVVAVVRGLFKNGAPLRALNWAKQRAVRVEREGVPVAKVPGASVRALLNERTRPESAGLAVVGAACQKRVQSPGQYICDWCGSLWVERVVGVGWLPLSCPGRNSPGYRPQPGAFDRLMLRPLGTPPIRGG